MTCYVLDPQLTAYIQESSTFTPVTDSLADRREAFADACRHFTPPRPLWVAVEDQEVEGLRVRIYMPTEHAPTDGWATMLYFHGGGWNMGSHKTHDWFVYALLRRVKIAVVAVDYRLAPEHPFPAPLEDGLKVWKAIQAGCFPDLDRNRMMVSGDSAGGALAAGLCVALKELALPQPRLQILVYPVLSARVGSGSMKTHANAPMLTTAGLLASLEGYVPGSEHKSDFRALPLELRDADGLAPAFIGVAQYDPLFDHGVDYARRLRSAGVPCDLYVGEGLVHASLRASGVAAVEDFYDEIGRSIRKSVVD